ncbi:MAG TPA: ribbon-helix-helix domain-containing protein [Alphaproteobacteria bacterium]
MAGSIQKRSVIIAGHRTSVSLEPEFWAALKEIAQHRALSINELVTEVDGQRRGNLSSALRVYVLTFLQGRLAAAAESREAATPPINEGVSS